MKRTFVSALVGSLLAVGSVWAAQNPAVQDPAVANQELRGKIVRIEPQTGMVVIRTGTGAKAQDVEYQVGKATRYYGRNGTAVQNGLLAPGFRQGIDVWYRVAPRNINTGRGLSELRLGPTAPVPANPPR